MMESDAVAHHLFLFRKQSKVVRKSRISFKLQLAVVKAVQSIAHHVLLNSLQFFGNNALRVFIFFSIVWLTRLAPERSRILASGRHSSYCIFAHLIVAYLLLCTIKIETVQLSNFI